MVYLVVVKHGYFWCIMGALRDSSAPMAKKSTPFPPTCKPQVPEQPILRLILEQRSCSGNFPYYLLGGQGFIKKYKSGPV